MSIADRDWYEGEHRKRDPWSHPLSGDSGSANPQLAGFLRAVTWVILFAAAMGGSVAAHDWWERKRGAAAPEVKQPLPVQGFDQFNGDPNSPPGARTAPDDWQESLSPAETREVAKCLVNGHATYSDHTDCQAGARVTVPIRRGPSVDEVREAQSQADALAEQAAEVDLRLRWDAWYRSQATVRTPAGSLSEASECTTLEQAIQGYDAQARQPQHAGMQDWIKDQRSQARSRQFALHC